MCCNGVDIPNKQNGVGLYCSLLSFMQVDRWLASSANEPTWHHVLWGNSREEGSCSPIWQPETGCIERNGGFSKKKNRCIESAHVIGQIFCQFLPASADSWKHGCAGRHIEMNLRTFGKLKMMVSWNHSGCGKSFMLWTFKCITFHCNCVGYCAQCHY